MPSYRLKIETIKSCVVDSGKIAADKVYDFVAGSIDKKEEYFVIAHKYYGVQIGRVVQRNFIFNKDRDLEPEFLLELRIFNRDSEFHFVREDNNFSWRLRLDGEGEKREVYDEMHVILGSKAESVGSGWSLLSESTGSRIYVPFILQPETRMHYKVRNYIADEELVRFEDARITGFFDSSGKSFE